jgi:hypothetical protein
MRNGFAMRERRGKPRVVPGFRYHILLGMPLFMAPGSSIIARPGTSMPTGPSPRSEQLGTPDPPSIRFTRGTYFGASRFTHLLRPAKLLAPPVRIRPIRSATGGFTSRLPTDRLPFPLLLCWRDSHPLEWQLASLHQIIRAKVRLLARQATRQCQPGL